MKYLTRRLLGTAVTIAVFTPKVRNEIHKNTRRFIFWINLAFLFIFIAAIIGVLVYG